MKMRNEHPRTKFKGFHCYTSKRAGKCQQSNESCNSILELEHVGLSLKMQLFILFFSFYYKKSNLNFFLLIWDKKLITTHTHKGALERIAKRCEEV